MTRDIVLSAYCLEWHSTTSDAFRDLLVEPLKPYARVRLTPWDGVAWAADSRDSGHYGEPLVFCQLPPPSQLLADATAHLVWIPMWDDAMRYPDEWWEALPKSLRIVAFSDAVASRAQGAGLPTLSVRYFKDPSRLEQVRWDKGRVLMYWNRTALVGPRFLAKLCAALEVERLLFMSQTDPRLPWAADYRVPRRLGTTEIQTLSWFASRSEYLEATRDVNIYIAPRAHEGVGMGFLESLARGCAVLGANAPTMNEYITNGKSGLLFDLTVKSSPSPGAKWSMLPLFSRYLGQRSRYVRHYLSECQEWGAVSRINVENLGRSARREHEAGFAAWLEEVPDYARFVLEW